jgi:Fe2+ or Zn2+ uptake regulation protein
MTLTPEQSQLLRDGILSVLARSPKGGATARTVCMSVRSMGYEYSDQTVGENIDALTTYGFVGTERSATAPGLVLVKLTATGLKEVETRNLG